MPRLRSPMSAALAGAGLMLALAMIGEAVPAPPRAQPQPVPPRSSGPELGDPIAGIGPIERALFLAGKEAFSRPPTVPGGLGPVFTEDACVVCHDAGATGGAGVHPVTHVGRFVNGQYDQMADLGGPIIQPNGIGRVNGVNFKGGVVPPQATFVVNRRAIPVFGLGLVDAVPDSTFVAIAQAQAENAPAIAGRPSMVTDPATGLARVGKFGWKAQDPSLLVFAGDATLNDLGVTTPLFPVENCPQGNCAIMAANPALADPNDPTNDQIQLRADFITFLAPPPRGPVGPAERAGEQLFGQIGCAACHVPTLQTGPSPSPALSGVTFAPYSDFLLHDMGALGDGIIQANTGQREMRTAPLWGLRFEPALLHDGRAQDAREAILAHDGQGKPARDLFTRLNQTQQAQLIAFLNSL